MTDTNVLIHCPACGVRLNVPAAAAGHRARCPNCKNTFQVPQPDQMLDDMVTCWLNLDELDNDDQAEQIAEEVLSDRTAAGLDPPSEAEESEAPAPAEPESQPQAIEDTDKTVDLDPSEAPPVPPRQSQSLRRHSRPTERKPSRASAGSVVNATRAEDAEDAPTEPAAPVGKPQTPDPSVNLSRRGDDVRLRVMKITSGGVRFRFPSKLLDMPGFRASMPMCDVFTGQCGEDVTLTARPLAWVDKALGSTNNAGELEARYEVHVRASQKPIDVARSMRTIDELPPPFCQAMPYYVAKDSVGKASVHCESFHTPLGIHCEVVVPSAPVALQWMMRVNGVCGDDYLELEQQVRKLESTAWQAIPEKVRNRLVVWFDFVAGERFLAYFNDGDFSSADSGLAGMIVTDKRMVYCKFHSHGEIAHDQPATLVALQSGRFGSLVLRGESRDRRIVKLRTDDLSELAVLLDEVESKVDLRTEEAPEPTRPATEESAEGA